MTLVRAKTYIDGDPLSAAEVNYLWDQVEHGVDGVGGGNYSGITGDVRLGQMTIGKAGNNNTSHAFLTCTNGLLVYNGMGLDGSLQISSGGVTTDGYSNFGGSTFFQHSVLFNATPTFVAGLQSNGLVNSLTIRATSTSGSALRSDGGALIDGNLTAGALNVNGTISGYTGLTIFGITTLEDLNCNTVNGQLWRPSLAVDSPGVNLVDPRVTNFVDCSFVTGVREYKIIDANSRDGDHIRFYAYNSALPTAIRVTYPNGTTDAIQIGNSTPYVWLELIRRFGAWERAGYSAR